MPSRGKPTVRAAAGKVRVIAIVALFLVGAAIMLYPAYSYLYNEYLNARAAAEYQAAVDAGSNEEMAEALALAREYNARHTANVIFDPFGDGKAYEKLDATYAKMLSISGDKAMAYLDIPKIGQRLPVYHGAATEVLDQGIGHLPGTSLPVGGESSHCVLSGHRGLPTKKLFTDLDQLEPGDKFFIHVMGEVLAYQVDGTQVVKPEEIGSLDIRPGEDLCTLVTCTPYAVNTHRMLVTGHRVPYVEQEDAPNAFSWLAAFSPQTLALAACLSLVAIAGLVVLARRLKGKGGKQR